MGTTKYEVHKAEEALYVDAPSLPGLINSGNSNCKTGDITSHICQTTYVQDFCPPIVN